MPFRLPIVDRCCGCVIDLKIAAAIIAVLGIVTCPGVSWAVVRHSYVIRMACFVTTSTSRADVLDINLNNIISFGFGANAGLSPSCLSQVKNPTDSGLLKLANDDKIIEKSFVKAIKYLGWMVFISDMFFALCSIQFLINLFKGLNSRAIKLFMYSAIMSVTLSFTYGMLYVGACLSVGGAFPVFEFVFSVVDVALWVYFLIVVNSYRRSVVRPQG